MYGAEYLDWCDKERVAAQIDQFLADMPPEDRKWALAILRERHTVYRDGDLSAWTQAPHEFALQRMAAQRGQSSALGSLGNIFGL